MASHEQIKKTIDPLDTYKKCLADMNIGDSFFVDKAKPADLGFLRRLAKRQGVTLSIRWVLLDQIYGKAGTRVYRVK